MRLFPLFIDCKTGKLSLHGNEDGCWHTMDFLEEERLPHYRDDFLEGVRAQFEQLHKDKEVRERRYLPKIREPPSPKELRSIEKTFDELFPELKEKIFAHLDMPPLTEEETRLYESSVIKQHCLSKQRVREKLYEVFDIEDHEDAVHLKIVLNALGLTND